MSGPPSNRVPFLDAAMGRPSSRTPVWFMRQAGRSLPEYRAVRGDGSILDAIKQPELAAAITLQPVRRYGVDAAVLFSDIVVPAHAVGFGIDVAPGTGPVAVEPLRSRSDLDRLRPLEAQADTDYVVDTVRALVDTLPDDVPLLAFAGAPFTVASYLIEGRPSRTYQHTKQMMHTDPRLSAADYRTFVLPHSTAVFTQLAERHPAVPGIHFGIGCDHLLELMLQAARGDGRSAPVLGLDWRTTITDARRRMGAGLVVQGNLDPALVLAGVAPALEGTAAVLADNAGHPGHVFNLGHGVQPDTDPDVLSAIVQHVHQATEQPTAAAAQAAQQ
jgi:uroporphyrinogen decarboxylase